MKLLIDTWGWLTLRDRRETKHDDVNAFFQDFLNHHGIVYTTDYILDETFTMLYRRLPSSLAKESIISTINQMGIRRIVGKRGIVRHYDQGLLKEDMEFADDYDDQTA